jgi:hypothetical protein
MDSEKWFNAFCNRNISPIHGESAVALSLRLKPKYSAHAPISRKFEKRWSRCKRLHLCWGDLRFQSRPIHQVS